MKTERKFDIEDRLIDFSSRVIDVVEALPNTRAGNYIAGNLLTAKLNIELLIVEY